MALTIIDDFSDKGFLRRILDKPESQRDPIETAFLDGHIAEEVSRAKARYASTPELRRMVAIELAQNSLAATPKTTGDGE